MMAMLVPWWRGRTDRERWLLAIMTVLLVASTAWFGMIRPLAQARSAAAMRHDLAIGALADVEAMTKAIRRAELTARPTLSIPLVELVGQRTSEAGLTTERMDTSGDGRVTLRIAAVRPAPLLRWLAEIAARDGIMVESLATTRNDDATIAVELALRSGGGR